MSTKYVVVKIWVAIFFLTPGICIFSQISHEDSINYFEYSKMNISLGNDIRGKTIPGFNAKAQNGALFTDDDLHSKITFINFWFEACAPCLAEFRRWKNFIIIINQKKISSLLPLHLRQTQQLSWYAKKIILLIQFIVYPVIVAEK